MPNASIQLSGNGAARAIKVTPVKNRSGGTTIDVKVTDGTNEAHETFQVAVLTVNQVPTAVIDGYSVGATQTLTVAAADGVLKNDTDVETSSLQAQLIQGPAHGILSLNPNGSFTYTPAASYAGSDTFTYRASDGVATSSPAIVTITVVPSRCAPRATVKVTTTVGNGKLQATVEALPLSSQSNNRLKVLRFGELQNGRVTIGLQAIPKNSTYQVPPATTTVTILVERITPGQATTIPLTVEDECGAWPTFVGGGAGAGF